MNQDLFLEQLKLSADYIKHITTLSTGAIVLITIFLEKLFKNPRWKQLVVTSLGGYMLSLIMAVIAFTALLYPLPTSGVAQHVAVASEKMWQVALFGTWLGFLTGSISLAVFAVGNLTRKSANSPTQE